MTVSKFVVATAVLLSVAGSTVAGEYDLVKAAPVHKLRCPLGLSRCLATRLK